MSCCKKISTVFSMSGVDADTFLCLNKEKILTTKPLMNALFLQYRNYLYKSARKIANKYPSIELEELVSEGFEGVLKALEKYNCKESSFLTYAQHWVRMKMCSAARKSMGLVSLPSGMYPIISRVKAALDKEPNLGYGELAVRLGESESRIAMVLDIIKTPKSGGLVDSLEEYVTYEDSYRSGEYEDISLESTLIKKDFSNKFWSVVSSVISKKELFVLELLFGRGGEMRRSLEWVAKVLRISKERVRQIKETAFRKLRDSDSFLDLVDSEEPQLLYEYNFEEEG